MVSKESFINNSQFISYFIKYSILHLWGARGVLKTFYVRNPNNLEPMVLTSGDKYINYIM